MHGGFTVALAGRRREPLDAVVEEGEKTDGKSLAVATDISDPVSVKNLFTHWVDTFGRLDLLVNNARVSAPTSGFGSSCRSGAKLKRRHPVFCRLPAHHCKRKRLSQLRRRIPYVRHAIRRNDLISRVRPRPPIAPAHTQSSARHSPLRRAHSQTAPSPTTRHTRGASAPPGSARNGLHLAPARAGCGR